MNYAFSNKSDAFWCGIKQAFGAPLWVLFAGMVGFGAMVHGSGLGVGFAGLTSLLLFALPGQVVLVEMLTSNAPALAIVLAVTLTSSRFIMMTITLFPQIAPADRNRRLYAHVHLLAMTAWALSMREFHKIAPEYRLRYFIGLGLPCWLVALPGTVLGYYVAGSVPAPVTLALVFINPLFFLLTFTDVKPRANQIALVLGCLLGPAFYLLDPSSSLLAAGLTAGTLAYLVDRSIRLKASP